MSTYQLGAEQQWGTSYKITPETTEVELNVMKCFQVNGTKDEAVAPQPTLPDLQGFQVCLKNKSKLFCVKFEAHLVVCCS